MASMTLLIVAMAARALKPTDEQIAKIDKMVVSEISKDYNGAVIKRIKVWKISYKGKSKEGIFQYDVFWNDSKFSTFATWHIIIANDNITIKSIRRGEADGVRGIIFEEP